MGVLQVSPPSSSSERAPNSEASSSIRLAHECVSDVARRFGVGGAKCESRRSDSRPSTLSTRVRMVMLIFFISARTVSSARGLCLVWCSVELCPLENSPTAGCLWPCCPRSGLRLSLCSPSSSRPSSPSLWMATSSSYSLSDMIVVVGLLFRVRKKAEV